MGYVLRSYLRAPNKDSRLLLHIYQLLLKEQTCSQQNTIGGIQKKEQSLFSTFEYTVLPSDFYLWGKAGSQSSISVLSKLQSSNSKSIRLLQREQPRVLFSIKKPLATGLNPWMDCHITTRMQGIFPSPWQIHILP